MAKKNNFDFKNLNNNLNSGKPSDSLNNANNTNQKKTSSNLNINQHLNAMFNKPMNKQNSEDASKQSSGRLEFGSTGYAGAKTPIKPTTGGEIKLPVFKTPKQLKKEKKEQQKAEKQKQQTLNQQLKELQQKGKGEQNVSRQSSQELFSSLQGGTNKNEELKNQQEKISPKPQPSLAELIASQKRSAAKGDGENGVNDNKELSKKSSKIVPEKDFFSTLEDMFKTSSDKGQSKELTEEEKQKEILEQLQRIQNQKITDKKEKKKKKRGFFWIFLLSFILLLIIGAGIYIYYYIIVPSEYEHVRISVSIVNADQVFYKTSPNGDKVPIAIDPGDSFNLIVVASNSSDIRGDKDSPNWSDLFVRFRIWVEIEGVNYYNFIDLSQDTNKWHRYNKEQEDSYLNEQGRPIVVADDGYYYYKSILPPNMQINVIEKITFNLHNITEEVAGKNATIHVQIEVLEDYSQIINRTYWSTAPHEWLIYLQQYVMGY